MSMSISGFLYVVTLFATCTIFRSSYAFSWNSVSSSRGFHLRVCESMRNYPHHSTIGYLSTTSRREDVFMRRALPSPEESAQALTDFMAKAHEEKLRALEQVEKKYKAEVEDLRERLEKYEADDTKSTAGVAGASSNSYEFPATNKALSEKVTAYRQFMSDYIVKAHLEKVKAVRDAEQKMKDKYEAIIKAMDTA